MIKPTSWSSREESLLLLNAYIDNELDAASALDVEHRLESDTALKAEYDRLRQLHIVLKSGAARPRASDDLRRRIAQIADVAGADVVPLRPSPISFKYRGGWRQLAVAAALAAFVAGTGTYSILRQDPVSNDVAAIVADHRRALLAATPYDVASSDRHTVKPWFDSKLALSPQVVDLAASGFPLAGGRVEILNGKAVPVLVYQRHAHVISVVAVPSGRTSALNASSLVETRDGYSVIGWRGRDFDYFAVSDIAENELGEFVASWRNATADH
jgi:anti-sigma factor RsiW